MPNSGQKIFAALDTTDVEEARNLALRLKGSVGGVKLGLEFFSANGAAGVREIAKTGLPIFLDLKFHDIPNTVAGAVRAVMGLRPKILNVHAAGGPAMMRAAVEAAREAADAQNIRPPLVIAVTVLTSLDDDDLTAVGQTPPAADQVIRLARLTQDCGLDGIVCSPRETASVRAACGPDFKLIVPGIRPNLSVANDQKRTSSPSDAINAGADYLVIGRPITKAPDPAAAARAMAAALTES
ncbi:MAG: orotidine-5'-phosphate decarboxylase [Alphaproteobacteria bacterium]|nr:orotidine-5'-phosphate decarboxylase [Alphaproteobacteria bacterium]